MRQFTAHTPREKALTIAGYIVLAVAAIPGIYYLLVIYSSIRYFRVARRENPPNTDFFPPISCLKPIRGLDEDAYENYASFCRQDYPGEYEIVFCVDPDDPALPVLEQLVRDFPTARSACCSAPAATPSTTRSAA